MIIGVHGIRDSGPRTTDLLTAYLASRFGMVTLNFIYPPVRIWTAERNLDRNALMLLKFIESRTGGSFRGVSIVTHSYGALIVHRLLEIDLAIRLDRLHLVAPAMLRDADWGRVAHKFASIDCYVNPKDLATRFASMSHIIAPRLGAAGNKGFTDPVVTNHYRRDGSGLWNHSRAWFDRDGLAYLGGRISGGRGEGGD